MDHRGTTISRRQLGRGALGATAVTLLGRRRAQAQPLRGTGEVVVCTWGGSYAEAQKKAFFELL
jgi:hypothetical protein